MNEQDIQQKIKELNDEKEEMERLLYLEKAMKHVNHTQWNLKVFETGEMDGVRYFDAEIEDSELYEIEFEILISNDFKRITFLDFHCHLLSRMNGDDAKETEKLLKEKVHNIFKQNRVKVITGGI